VVVLNAIIQEYRILNASVLWGQELDFKAGITILEMTKCGTQGQLVTALQQCSEVLGRVHTKRVQSSLTCKDTAETL
jgi:hypothetical protein